jgi:ubiquinone/menaquinone biosynthesis C-methylase UbiE
MPVFVSKPQTGPAIRSKRVCTEGWDCMQGDGQLARSGGSSLDEESRIREIYARRRTEVNRRLYSFFNKGNLLRIQELERGILAVLERYDRQPLDQQRILEIGCGTGYWLREFIKWGARPEKLVGVDLLRDRIEEARSLCPSNVTLYCQSATKLCLPDATFDLVLQSTVFTSIGDIGTKQQIALEMVRVLKPNGLILWYDFLVDNPRNPDVRGVKKKEVLQLFPKCEIELRRITLAPPVARFIALYSQVAFCLLGKFPSLCTHYLGVIRPR